MSRMVLGHSVNAIDFEILKGIKLEKQAHHLEEGALNFRIYLTKEFLRST